MKSNPRIPSFSYLLAGLTIGVALFYGGYILGEVSGARSVIPEGEARVLHQGDESGAEDIDFSGFWEIWDLVKDSYIDQPVSEQDLYYGALEGLLGGLDDPYSTYFDPEVAAAFNAELEGTFFGIGAEIASKDEYVTIVAPLEGSPSDLAGVMPGDRVLEIDGNDAFGISVNEAVFQIRGEEGTEVVLTILREGEEELLEISIVRSEIKVDSVNWEIQDDGIAVISVSMFNDDTTDLFQSAVQEVLTSDVKGIVLDLRNNPGGLLTEAINLAGFWVNGSTVVIERVQEAEREFASSGVAQLNGIKTVVLVNGGSASGSEILAGALQDYGYATIIGEQTFGKGSVQEYYELPDGSAVKITVAEWLTPNGSSINEIGITPDIIVEYTSEDFYAEATPQFDKAISLIKGE